MSPTRSKEAQHGTTLLGPVVLLTPEQVLQEDRALASIEPFGEVQLVEAKGRLRFIQKLDSHDLLRGERALGIRGLGAGSCLACGRIDLS